MLILASESPRRRELLALAGFEFMVRARPVAEIRSPGEYAVDYVRRLAREKARAAQKDERESGESVKFGQTTRSTADVARGANALETGQSVPIFRDFEGEQDIVLGADTVVVLGERVLEKPVDTDDAKSMLRALSGREHTVITGVCLLRGDREIVDTESTRVHFVEWGDREIEEYVATGEPMDKAGAYAIQGRASKFVERIEGCYFNVMGLPLAMVYRHWKALEIGR